MTDILKFNPISPADMVLKFSISEGHPAEVTNVAWKWGDLVKRLRRSDHDALTIAQFRALTEDQQLRRKNNGYFVGAQFDGERRRKVNMRERALLTFDIDDCSPEILADLELGTSGLGDVEYVVYSTRKHVMPNNIRLRIVIPLAKPLGHDKFQAVSRILASRLDPSMQTVDRVSFSDAQFMYWPSHCADVKPYFLHNRGAHDRLVDPEVVLAEFGPDWKDFTKLPRASRESEGRRPTEKMQNPLTKRGIVGAFCRSYNIHEAIEEFLSDVYKPSEPGRYTYIPGSTSNGCVVYDDGNAFFSHHGTDPAGDRSNNSFDLVRIHCFGHLDSRADADTPPHKMPSFKAMSEMLLKDDAVQDAYRDQRITEDDIDASFDVEDDDDEAETPGEVTSDDPDRETLGDKKRKRMTIEEAAADPNLWKLDLDMTAEGMIKSRLDNLVLILRNAKVFKGRFGFSEFHHEHVVRKPLISKKLNLRIEGPTISDPLGRLNDHHLAGIRLILETPLERGGWGLIVSDRDLTAAHSIVSRERPFHPVRDYLETLEWDGIARLEKMWVRACHTADTSYFRETAKFWMVAGVQRVYEPGSKFDFCPIIEGPQGHFKSTLLNTIGGGWTTELTPHFDSPQKLVESTLGYWIVEIPELAHFGKAEVAQIKALITEQAAKGVRMAYARTPGYFPRQFLFAGTTNDEHYLRDQTGNRRFWPIPCDPKRQIDIKWVRDNRDQLWAEAKATYHQMRAEKPTGNLPLYLTGGSAAEATTTQASRMVDDGVESMAGRIEYWLGVKVPAAQAKSGAEPGDFTDDAEDQPLEFRMETCAIEIHEKALGGRPKEYSQKEAQTIGKAMRLIAGWVTSKVAVCGIYGRQRTYRRLSRPDEGSEDGSDGL